MTTFGPDSVRPTVYVGGDKGRAPTGGITSSTPLRTANTVTTVRDAGLVPTAPNDGIRRQIATMNDSELAKHISSNNQSR